MNPRPTAHQRPPGPGRTAGGGGKPMHDAASAILGRQERNQHPRVVPAGAESAHSNQTSGDDNDDPDVTFPNFPRVTRNQARQLNLHVSSEGLPPKDQTEEMRPRQASTANLMRSEEASTAFSKN